MGMFYSNVSTMGNKKLARTETDQMGSNMLKVCQSVFLIHNDIFLIRLKLKYLF